MARAPGLAVLVPAVETLQQAAKAKGLAGEEPAHSRLVQANHPPLDQESEALCRVGRFLQEPESLGAQVKCGAFLRRFLAQVQGAELVGELDAAVTGVGVGVELAGVPDRPKMRSLEYWARLRVSAMSALGKVAWLLLERFRSRCLNCLAALKTH